MTEEDFESLIEDSTAYLQRRIAEAGRNFGVGDWEEYHYDFESGSFRWLDSGILKVEARLIPVGTISTVSDTWLWSWANPSLVCPAREEIEQVRRFGVERRVQKLTESKWPGSEVDGWEMTAAAARLLEAETAYRSPSENGFFFMLLSHLTFAE